MSDVIRFTSREYKSLVNSLHKVQKRTQKRAQFIRDYRDVFKFPQRHSQETLEAYNEVLAALDILIERQSLLKF
jgi:hypothetical protein